MANITNRFDLLKFLLGAIAILLTVTVIYGALFSNARVENAPVSFEEIKKESSELTTNSENTETKSNTQNYDNSNVEENTEETNTGYIDLLEDDTSSNNSEDLTTVVVNNENSRVKTGVVIEVEDEISNDDTNAFVKNPTVVGDTPAEVAKKQNQLESEEKNTEEDSNDSLKQKAYLAKQEQLKQKQLAQQRKKEEYLKKKQALEEQAKIEAEKKKQLEEKKKKELEAKKAKAQKELEEKKEAEAKKVTLLKNTTEAKVSSDPMDRINVINRSTATSTSEVANRYLKVGVYSSLERAYSVKKQIQKARISLNSEQRKQIGKNFSIKVDKVDSFYHVTIGPAKNDSVLNAIKPKIASLGFKDMVIISK